MYVPSRMTAAPSAAATAVCRITTRRVKVFPLEPGKLAVNYAGARARYARQRRFGRAPVGDSVRANERAGEVIEQVFEIGFMWDRHCFSTP